MNKIRLGHCLLVYSLLAVNSQSFTQTPSNSTLLQLSVAYGATYTVQCSAYQYFSVYFQDACKDLIVSLLVKSGQPDIYAKKADVDKDPYPTKEKLTWAAYSDNDFTLTISQWDLESSPGYYYIGVYNDCTNQNKPAVFKIEAFPSQDPFVAVGLTDLVKYPWLGELQSGAPKSYQFYRFCVSKCSNVKIELDTLSYPELLVSRQHLLPSLRDYRYYIYCILSYKTYDIRFCSVYGMACFHFAASLFLI